jgi:hypothetical protein
MDFGYEFWNAISQQMHSAIYELDRTLDFVADHSEFVCVDGEEGDYGKVTYRTPEGVIVAVRTILGGDDEETVFTPEGKVIMTNLLVPMLFKVLADE